MREYGRVHCTFWIRPDVRSGDDDTRLLALYLLTCPHSNAIGAFLCPDNYIADDLQWTIERVRQTLSKLFAKGFAKRFVDNRHIVVCEYLKENPLENPNVAKAALRQADQLPWHDPAFEHVFKGLEQYRERFGTEWEKVSKRYGQACRNREPEPEPEPEREPEPQPTPEPESSLPLELVVPESSNVKADPFEEWWNLVPLKVSKQDARKEFERIIRNKTATIEQLTTGMVVYAAACANKDPKFIRHPHRWLKGGCWGDVPPPDSNFNSGGSNGRQSGVGYMMEKLRGQVDRDD